MITFVEKQYRFIKQQQDFLLQQEIICQVR